MKCKRTLLELDALGEEKLEYIGKGGIWIGVRTDNGLKGFVKKQRWS